MSIFQWIPEGYLAANRSEASLLFDSRYLPNDKSTPVFMFFVCVVEKEPLY